MEAEKPVSRKPVRELPACPVETTLTLISYKWKVLILRDLMRVSVVSTGQAGSSLTGFRLTGFSASIRIPPLVSKW